jgi:hypothetical protein
MLILSGNIFDVGKKVTDLNKKSGINNFDFYLDTPPAHFLIFFSVKTVG